MLSKVSKGLRTDIRLNALLGTKELIKLLPVSMLQRMQKKITTDFIISIIVVPCRSSQSQAESLGLGVFVFQLEATNSCQDLRVLQYIF